MKSLVLILMTILMLLPIAALAELNLNIFSPPQGEKFSEQELLLNGQEQKLICYNTSLSPRDALDFYANSLTNQGWQIKEDRRKEGVIKFVNGEDNAEIAAIKMPQDRRNNKIFIKLSKGEQALPGPEGLTSDVPGEDIASAPRFPGSIRGFSLKSEQPKGQLNIYQSNASVDEIAAYYAQSLNEKWQSIKSQFTGMEGRSLIYSSKKGKATLLITIIKNPEGQGTLITVKINE